MANPRLPLALCLALCAVAALSACQEEAKAPRNPTASPTPTAPTAGDAATRPTAAPPSTNIPGATGNSPNAGASPTAAAAAAGAKCTVQGVSQSYLNFRSGPSTSANDIGDLPDGTVVDFVANDTGGWVKIRYNGQEGFACDSCNGDDNLNCEGASMTLDGAPPVRSKHPNPDGSFG